jgi:hypothetical protein
VTREAVLFLTHTPDAFPVGVVWDRPEDWGGGTFVITKLVRLAPTALLNGGQAACYEVRGRSV